MNKRFPSLDDVLLHCGELNKRETVAVQWALKAAREYMLSQKKIDEMSTKKPKPLLSDEQVLDSRSYPPEEIRDIYEAARAKDAKLIQRLVDDIAMLQAVFATEAGYETRWGDDGLAAAAAAGFKPNEQ